MDTLRDRLVDNFYQKMSRITRRLKKRKHLVSFEDLLLKKGL